MFFKHFSRKKIQFTLFIIDLIVALFAVWFSLFMRKLQIPSFKYWIYHVKAFIPVFFYAICAMYLAGLYIVTIPTETRKLCVKYAFIGIVGWFLGFVFFYFKWNKINFPKTILFLFWIVFGVLEILVRLIMSKHFIHRQIPVIFLGDSISQSFLSEHLSSNKMLGFNPLFIYKQKGDKEKLIEIIKSTTSDIVYVFRYSDSLLSEINDVLHSLIADHAKFIEYSEFYEYIERKIPPEDIGESWFLSNISLYSRRVYFFIKRICDICASLIGIILTIWIYPILILAIKLESKGSAFFVQSRQGINGKAFNLIKFRTMRTDQNNGEATVKNDQRITKMGKILRACRLDEIPQLWNVLKGDMSLIGPRPERPEFAEILENEVPWFRQRLLVRPGITGWDQVCGEYHSPSKEDTYKKLQNDLYYIKNCSISLDVSILFKTIATMVRREGR